MEFWGAEVKTGEPLLVNLGEGKILHLSQASLGEVKKDKGKESVSLNLNIDGKKLVLGTLNSDKLPQQLFDLVFHKSFELSHTWKNGSVYFYGYTAPNHDDQGPDDSDSDSEEDIPLHVSDNGKQEKPPTHVVENANAVKESGAGKKVKIVEPKKDVKDEEDEDSSDDSDAMSEDESDSEEDSEDSSDDEDDNEDSDEDEETPKKAESSKKRPPSESGSKTPVPSKKAKVITPQKTDGKKGGVHVATPHPAKKTGKTHATAASTSNPNKSNQSPKSEGSHSCKSCNRSFKSDSALDSHNKAKHSSGK